MKILGLDPMSLILVQYFLAPMYKTIHYVVYATRNFGNGSILSFLVKNQGHTCPLS
jgi:hypothetical protein